MIKILAFNFLIAQLGMLLSFYISRRLQQEIIADIAWPLGIGLQGTLYSIFSVHCPEKTWLCLLLWIWSLRLAFFLYWNRLRLPWKDKRYEKLIENSPHSPPKALFINYQIQACLQWLMGLSWFFVMQKSSFNPVTMLAASAIFILGMSIEIIADEQLKQFKRNSHGTVCQNGLWQYSRHPNYFGECIIWISFAMNSPHLWGWCSPLFLYMIMRFITGPLTEQTSLVHKGQRYRQYQQTTPMIFPYKLFFSRRSK